MYVILIIELYPIIRQFNDDFHPIQRRLVERDFLRNTRLDFLYLREGRLEPPPWPPAATVAPPPPASASSASASHFLSPLHSVFLNAFTALTTLGGRALLTSGADCTCKPSMVGILRLVSETQEFNSLINAIA